MEIINIKLIIGIFLGYTIMFLIYKTPLFLIQDNLEDNVFIDENKVCYTYKRKYIN